MEVYEFTDGYKAFFYKGNVKDHILVGPDDFVKFDLPIKVLHFRKLKISYGTWRKQLSLKR